MDNTYLVVGDPQMVVANDMDASVTEVSLRGLWSGELRSAAAQRLRACIAETPRAVIIDLADLSDPDGASAPTWCTAHRYAATRRPGVVEVILVAPPEPLVRRLQGSTTGRAIATAATVPAARDKARRPPWQLHQQLSLPARAVSPVDARTMAGDTCLQWGLPRLAYPARFIVSELADNAVRHAGTELTVTVSVRGQLLHLAVRDRHRDLPQLIEAGSYRPGDLIEQPGAGLRLVRSTAAAWGALPCQVGKVVWATLNLPQPEAGR